MKKGCFTVIAFLIFITGVGYYIYQKYGEEIKEEAKKKIVQLAFDNLNERLLEINPKIDSDSLVNSISDIILEKAEDLEINELGAFAEKIIKRVSDKLNEAEIENVDLSEIEKIIESYER